MENAGTDNPSSLDWDYQLVAGNSTGNVRKRYPFTIQNQWLQAKTKMACSRYGITHAINAQNSHRAWETNTSLVEIQALDLWLRRLAVNPSCEYKWDSLQSGLNQAKAEGLITGYAACLTNETGDTNSKMKNALDNYNFIYTGSQVADWHYVTTNHLYKVRTDGGICGHIFAIVDYDDEWFIAVNSYGEENGLFTIPYSLTDTLFTRYTIFDSKDEEAIANYKKSIMDNITLPEAKSFYTRGYTNGERPNDMVTRQEMWATLERIIVANNLK